MSHLSNFVDLAGTYKHEGTMKPVSYYGCVRCQVNHFEDTEPDIYNLHLYWQSKHSIQEMHETMEERKRRYEDRFRAEDSQ